ncbi:MAG: hypothetical protein QOH21_456 [Acidobacteriota bacterium]|jgi:hypothetical protein|nr:hypothetical protein [Acidobacteriota bacterium]
MIRPLYRLLLAGLTTGVTDGLFAVVLSVFFYGSTVTRLWQGVASVLLGKSALEGGTRTVLTGVLMHFGVAFAWSAVFLMAVLAFPWLRRIIGSRGGILTVAAVYGPLIWLVMSLLVIPALVHRPPTITPRWWIQLIGHAVFVGLPIVAWIGGGLRPPAPAASQRSA